MSEEDTRIQRIGWRPKNRRRGRAFLTVLSGREVGMVHRMGTGESVIGRGEEVDVQIIDEGVSRRHAAVMRASDGTAKIVDLGSTNGTYVNGRQIEVEVLREGDRIRIGQSATLDFRYEYNESVAEDDEPTASTSVAREVRSPSTSDDTAEEGAHRDNVELAIRAFKKTLAIREETFGRDHPAVAAILDTIATVLRKKGEFRRALEHQERALAIYDERVGDALPPPEMAHLLTNMGESLLSMGDAERALATLERALSMLEQRRAQDSELAAVRFAIARTLAALGRAPVRARSLASLASEGFAQATGGIANMEEVDDWLAQRKD